MKRRAYLATLVATGTAAVTGCGSILGGGSNTPTAVAESFVEALDQGDYETADELTIVTSVEAAFGSDQLQRWREDDISIESAEITEQNDRRTTVELTINGTGFNKQQQTWEFSLSRSDGTWQIVGFDLWQ